MSQEPSQPSNDSGKKPISLLNSATTSVVLGSLKSISRHTCPNSNGTEPWRLQTLRKCTPLIVSFLIWTGLALAVVVTWSGVLLALLALLSLSGWSAQSLIMVFSTH
jgi:hypothetical protein